MQLWPEVNNSWVSKGRSGSRNRKEGGDVKGDEEGTRRSRAAMGRDEGGRGGRLVLLR